MSQGFMMQRSDGIFRIIRKVFVIRSIQFTQIAAGSQDGAVERAWV